MTTVRLDIRLDKNIKAKAEKASVLLDMKSLNEYVVRLIDEDATRVIEEHQNSVAKANIFDEFMAACDKAQGSKRDLFVG